jgi:3-deoxy-7-phosphoheptulonate synthase
MVVVMRSGASDADITKVVKAIAEVGGDAFVSRGKHQTIVGLVGDLTQFAEMPLHAFPGVEDVIRVSKPYKLVSNDAHPRPSTVWVGDTPIGRQTVTLIAGPCAVETEEQTVAACRMAKEAGATILRGGAYKPRTSPYAFQGLGEPGLDLLHGVARDLDLPFVTEVVTPADVETVAAKADMLQIGARNMQNFQLLKEVGIAGKPVLIKRGLTATIDEWIMAAEYVAHTGNLQIVLCERGIRTYEPMTRNTLDVSAVPVAQSLTHLPVIVDPSHSGGKRELVLPLAGPRSRWGPTASSSTSTRGRRSRWSTVPRPSCARTCWRCATPSSGSRPPSAARSRPSTTSTAPAPGAARPPRRRSAEPGAVSHSSPSSPTSRSAARRQPAASTSRWVTRRSRCGPIAPTRTPSSASAATTSAAGRWPVRRRPCWS